MQKKKVPKLQLDKKAKKKSLKVTVRQNRQKKKFAKLELGLQNRIVSKVRVRKNVKKILQSHH